MSSLEEVTLRTKESHEESPILKEGSKVFILEYDLIVYNVISLEVNKKIHKVKSFFKIEDLVAEYRKSKDLTCMGIPATKNFHVYTAMIKEVNTEGIDVLL